LSESKSLESEQTSNNSELDLNINNFNLEESEESKISSNQEES
jgi:hypothetical protein